MGRISAVKQIISRGRSALSAWVENVRSTFASPPLRTSSALAPDRNELISAAETLAAEYRLVECESDLERLRMKIHEVELIASASHRERQKPESKERVARLVREIEGHWEKIISLAINRA